MNRKEKKTSGRRRREDRRHFAGQNGSKDGASQERPPVRPNEQAPVRKGTVAEVEIEGLTHEGLGVGKAEGFTLFAAGTLPGERARVRVTDVKKQYGIADLEALLRESEDRVIPPCPIYEACGGCQLQHLSYEAQLRWKRRMVIDNLTRIGKLHVAHGAGDETEDGADSPGSAASDTTSDSPDSAGSARSFGSPATPAGEAPALLAKDDRQATASGVIVHPTIGMKEPWRYRNKAAVPVGEREGGLTAGFYEQGSHRIVDMEACLIQNEQNDALIRHVRRIADELGIPAYDRARHEGILRHVVVRTGVKTKEMMVVLVTNGRHLPHADKFVERLREAVRIEQPGYRLMSICQNVNMKRTNVIFGDETRVLWGSETIEDRIGDIRFAISAQSFYQVNPEQTEVLYRKALEYAGLSGEETVIDAYCGIGTISLFLARRAKRVYGVEIVPEAIEDAKRNAELNGIRNVEFAVGRAEDVMPRWHEAGVDADVIVVDPPRKGCERSLLETIIAMKPKRVVYVSCNPSTLARDLRILEDGGFRTVEVQPVDMFPHSGHVECVILMVRKGA